MSKTINYIDLCCGIGGFRLAIQEFEKRNKSYKFGIISNKLNYS